MNDYAEVVVEFLSTKKGGRKTPICLGENAPSPYRPHFCVQPGDGEYLAVEFIDGPDEPIQPGQSSNATVRFLASDRVSYDALVVGAAFNICEGGRVIGSGSVTSR